MRTVGKFQVFTKKLQDFKNAEFHYVSTVQYATTVKSKTTKDSEII